MSKLHLGEGSEKPMLAEGKLRLYSMEYCPYAHRARLVLDIKKVPYDIVNVNLIKKPKWIFDVHPEGKVPALDLGSKIVVESLDIADFVDEQYPEPALYPNDPNEKAKDKELIKKIGPLTGVFTDLIIQRVNKTPAEWLDELSPHLKVFEDELERRGSVYFGGDKPGMVDLMLWPWAERAGIIAIILKDRLPITDDSFPKLRAWRKALRSEPVVDSIYTGAEKFHKSLLIKLGVLEPDYDAI